MLQGLLDNVELMDTLLIIAERRYEMKKKRSCKMEPQPRKRLRSPMITTKDVDPHTDLGNGLDGTMIMGLWCQPHDRLLEEIPGQIFRILTTSEKIELSNAETTRRTTMINTLTTEQDHNISRTKINLGSGEVTITIPDRLQRHDKIHPSRMFAENPNQIRLIPQCLTGWGSRLE